MSDKRNTTPKHFHPLEESVLSLAAGKLHQIEVPETPSAIRTVMPEEPVFYAGDEASGGHAA